MTGEGENVPAAPRPGDRLSDREQRFVVEYVVDKNPSAAALRAGFASGRHGRKLMNLPRVRQAIDAELLAQRARVRMSADDVLLRLMEKAQPIDVRRLYGPDGHLLPPTEWPQDIAQAVHSLETMDLDAAAQGRLPFEGALGFRTRTKKVTLKDHEMKALELLARHFKLLDGFVAGDALVDQLEQLARGDLRGRSDVLSVLEAVRALAGRESPSPVLVRGLNGDGTLTSDVLLSDRDGVFRRYVPAGDGEADEREGDD